MILTETIFLDGTPLGVVRRDDYSGEIAFAPIKGKSRLPAKDWKSMDELKEAVIAAYEQDHG